MFLSIEQAKEEIERILKQTSIVFGSACSLSTETAKDGAVNRLRIEIVYSPAFSKRDKDEIARKVLMRSPEKSEKKEEVVGDEGNIFKPQEKTVGIKGMGV